MILSFIFLLKALPAEAQRDSLSSQQTNFYIKLVKKLNHKFWFDSSRLQDKERVYQYRSPDNPAINICYDNSTYYFDRDGRKKRNGDVTFFTYDTIQKIFEYRPPNPFGGSTYHKAFFDDTSNRYEFYSHYSGDGTGLIELYENNRILYKSSDTSEIALVPYPLKQGKRIAIVANKEVPIQIKRFNVLTQSGKGASKRFLIEAVSDSTNKFYPYTTKFFISIYQNDFKKFRKIPGNFFFALREPGYGLIKYCGYINYYNIIEMYPAVSDMNSIELIYSYKLTFLRGKKFPKTNEMGFVTNAKINFVRKLRENKKLSCDEYDPNANYWHETLEQIEKTYELTFSDDFIIYLNKDKLGL